MTKGGRTKSRCAHLRASEGEEGCPAAPHLADVEGVADIRGGIPVEEEEVGAEARSDTSTVGEAEASSRCGGRCAQRLHGGEASTDEELEFVMDAGAVRETAEGRHGN